jgi:hypothetical protein
VFLRITEQHLYASIVDEYGFIFVAVLLQFILQKRINRLLLFFEFDIFILVHIPPQVNFFRLRCAIMRYADRTSWGD